MPSFTANPVPLTGARRTKPTSAVLTIVPASRIMECQQRHSLFAGDVVRPSFVLAPGFVVRGGRGR